MGELLRIPHVSVEDYLAGERVSDIRHEYVDGERFAMTGASRTHGLLCTNLLSRIAVHLEGGPCWVIASDMKVRPAHDTRFYYPDLVISGNDAADEEDDCVVTRPTILVEGLSGSTEQTDRREKRVAYQRFETLQEYLLVSQDTREVSVYRRDGEDWLLEVLGSGERTTLESIGLALDIDDLYRGTNVV